MRERRGLERATPFLALLGGHSLALALWTPLLIASLRVKRSPVGVRRSYRRPPLCRTLTPYIASSSGTQSARTRAGSGRPALGHLRIRLAAACLERIRQLLEEMLESLRRDDLDEPCGRRACIPEHVRDPSRLEDVRAGAPLRAPAHRSERRTFPRRRGRAAEILRSRWSTAALLCCPFRHEFSPHLSPEAV